DPEGKLLFANSAAARLCGFTTAEELVRTPRDELVARFDVLDERGNPVREAALPISRALTGDPSEELLLQVRERSSGKTRWFLGRTSPVLGVDGKPELVVNTVRDVSELRRQQQHEKYVAEATAALSTSLDYEQTLATLARMLVPAFGDWCAV